MKINVKKIEKDGKRLILYAKKPIFMNMGSFIRIIDITFRDYDNFLEVGVDCTGKYAILTFILRNKEDLLLYAIKENKQ